MNEFICEFCGIVTGLVALYLMVKAAIGIGNLWDRFKALEYDAKNNSHMRNEWSSGRWDLKRCQEFVDLLRRNASDHAGRLSALESKKASK